MISAAPLLGMVFSLPMDTTQIISQLKAERQRLDLAIQALEGLGIGSRQYADNRTPARSGRPAGKAAGKTGTKQAKPKRKISATARKKMSEAARARWAARKKAAKAK